MKELSTAIQRRRKELKLSQQELADLASCGITFINQLEGGKDSVRFDKLLDVLRVLGLKLTLRGGKNEVEVGEA